MSDMETSDVANDVTPAEPVAPETPETETPEALDATERTAEETAVADKVDELQAQVDAERALLEQLEAEDAKAPEPTPVAARVASSASPTQQPEAVPAVKEEPLSLADATRILLTLVKSHRHAGDGDVDAAIADVEAALAAQS